MSQTNAIRFPRGASGHDVVRQMDSHPKLRRVRQSGSHVIYNAVDTGATLIATDHRAPVSPGLRSSLIKALVAAGIVVTVFVCAFYGTLGILAK